MTALVTLATHLEVLRARLEDLEVDDLVLQEEITALEVSLEEKAVGTYAFTDQLEGLARSAKEMEERIAERRKRLEKRVASLREYVRKCMASAGKTEIACPEMKLRRQRGAPKVIIDSMAALPDEFKRWPDLPPPEADKPEIAKAIKAGVDVPGAHLDETETLRRT